MSPVYPASFRLACEASVQVLSGGELPSASAADQEMSLVSESKAVPSRQFAGGTLEWIHSGRTLGWLSSLLHHGEVPASGTALHTPLFLSAFIALPPAAPLPRVLCLPLLQAQSPLASHRCLGRQRCHPQP